MARQCHLDTCPTGIATQREDLRAKFSGTPEEVVRYFTAIAEDLRRELAAIGAQSVGEIVGRGLEFLRPAESATVRLEALLVARALGRFSRAPGRCGRRRPGRETRAGVAPGGLDRRGSSTPPRPVSAGPEWACG